MPKFTPQRQDQILRQMIAAVVARSELSDVADSSAIKHLLKAAARQDAEQYFQMTLLLDLFDRDKAVGSDLDERAAELNITRLQATAAIGNLVFSRPGTVGTVTIPIGTRAKTSSGTTFMTTSVGTIADTTTTSSPVAAIAVVAGSAGNVGSGTIVKFDSKPAGVEAVTNPSPFANGTDQETDDALRNRCRLFIQGLARCPEQAIEAYLLGATDPVSGKTVRSISAVTDISNPGTFNVYVDDGNGTAETTEDISGEIMTAGLAPGDVAVGGEQFLSTLFKPIKPAAPFTLTSSIRGALTTLQYTLNTSTGQVKFNPALVAGEQITVDYTVFTGLLAFVQKTIDGDKADRTNFPGLRAAGTIALVQSPSILIQTISAAITIKEGYSDTEVRSAVSDAVIRYVNSLSISGDVLKNGIVSTIMAVAGVYNVDLSTPSSDVTILDDQLARTATADVTIN